MPAAVKLRTDYSVDELRRLAKGSKDANQSRRLLSLARSWKGAHAVLLLDRAGWHTTTKLRMPKNITPIFLPPRAPELNRLRTSGNICAATGFPTACSTPTTHHRRRMRAGESSSLNPRQSLNRIRDWAHIGQSK